jgi:hypothetical protein
MPRQHLPVRAKGGYIRGKRYRKDGSVVSARLHPVSGIAGSISGREMETIMMDIADETGASYDDIVLETYAEGEAPRESNPNPGDRKERYTRVLGGERYRNNWERAFGKSSEEGECNCSGNCKCMNRDSDSLAVQPERK